MMTFVTGKYVAFLDWFKNLLLGIAVLSIAFSCDSSEVLSAHADYEYMPLQKGYFLIYDVEETVYTLGTPETQVYELRTIITDSIPNADGYFTYRMERSRKNKDAIVWNNLETWSVRRSKREVVVNEGNIPYVVLRFPLAKNTAWNGNSYNSVITPSTNLNVDMYQVEEKGISMDVNDLYFSDCLVVDQEDNQEYIVYFDKRMEVYARRVGLIQKEIIELQYCTEENRNCLGQQVVDNGRIYKQQIKMYGKE